VHSPLLLAAALQSASAILIVFMIHLLPTPIEEGNAAIL